jgi:hypothetical protein
MGTRFRSRRTKPLWAPTQGGFFVLINEPYAIFGAASKRFSPVCPRFPNLTRYPRSYARFTQRHVCG